MAQGPAILMPAIAAREAADGEEFADTIGRRFGVEVQVLSGKEEARLVGLTVAAAVSGADGVVGDLGGGSLELVEVKGGRIRNIATLPVGTLRLPAPGKRNAAKVAIVLIYTVLALAFYLYNGQVNLLAGLVLAVGNMSGAFIAARLAITKGADWIRWVVLAAALVAATKWLLF